MEKKDSEYWKVKSRKASPPSIGPDSDFSEWRTEWEPTVNLGAWVPKGRASEIIKTFPPYENGGSTENPIADQSTDIFISRIAKSRLDRCEASLQNEFAEHNAIFLKAQKEKLAVFFDTIERNPLTDEQMDSCICMDDAVQIVAAAGSGKTSTIVARIGYALKEGLARPEQILVLAFNRSVKEELEARIKERLGGIGNAQRVNVKTFNAFGLEVIGKSTGRKPRLADWVVQGRDVKAISEIVEDLQQRDPQFCLDWGLFRTIFGRDIGDWESTNQPRSDTGGKGSIQTADGKYVKSKEERMICDFLYYHGVAYEYEIPYEHDTVSEEHSQYHPDFYYPNIGLYHEHFALDANGNAPAHFTGDYVAGVHWKRALHAEKGTHFFETTSHEIRNNDALNQLKLELEQRGEVLDFDMNRPALGQEPIPTKQLASTIRAFQQHVKSNGLSHSDLHKVIAKVERGHRERLTRFVKLYERIADEWQRRLSAEKSVDFDDMLLMAIEHIESGKFQSPYTMILVDEFQDVSQSKSRLLKALKENAGPSSNLCVVGDDWQGINRFAGADISVMTDFLQAFQNSTQLILSKSFRCPQLLCDASSEFIQKNPKQIKKRVETTNTYERPLLHVFAAKTTEATMERLGKHLQKLYSSAKAGDLEMSSDTKVSVMLLGRYHKDMPPSFNAWKRVFGDKLNLTFSTVHASKGLEADYVMLLNVTEGLMGFPSQIVDDPVLQLAMPEPDNYLLAEERRLFYVALTRARRQTRIYSLRDKPSRFIIELAKDDHLEITTGKGNLKICPKCEKGTLSQKVGKYGPFEACSAHPACDYTKGVLSLVKNDKSSDRPVRLKNPISENATCPTCNRGTMVARNGQNNEPFLGCSSFPRCRTTASVSRPATRII